tara:strand:+ start:760 stop:1413 length:654 start_codon:yes stop_codon:yes gene_type:complete
MSKTLLTEREIRKFMKLSNLTPLRETFLSKLEEQEMADEEGPEEAPEGEEMPDMEMGGEEDVPEEGPEEAPGEDESMEAAVEQVVSAVVDALKGLPGAPDISMETEEGGEEMDLGGEEPEGLEGVEGEDEAFGAGMAAGGEEGGEEEEELMESLADAGIFLEDDDPFVEGWPDEEGPGGALDEYDDFGLEEAYLDEDEIVNEVTRRVGARLLRRLRR